MLFGVLTSRGAFAQNIEIDPSKVNEIREPEKEISIDDKLIKLFKEKPEIIDSNEGPPARTVRIDLQKAEGASFYQVEVVPSRKIWSEPMKFMLSGESLSIRLRLSPGLYSIRTRSLDEKKNPGRWSSYEKFTIQFRPLAKAYPPANEEIEPKGSKTEKILFEWPKVKNSKYYLFRLKDSAGNPKRIVITNQTWLASDLETSSSYYWSILPMSDQSDYKRLIRQEHLAPYTRFSILSADENGRGTMVQIKTHQRAKQYQFEVISVDAKDVGSAPSIFDSYDGKMRFRLKPGEYEMRARTIFTDGVVTEWSAPSRFFIKRFLPKLEGPATDATVESTDDEKSKVSLTWTKDQEGTTYKVYIFNSKEELVHQESTKENKLDVTLPHADEYKWMVKAYSAREPASEEITAKDAKSSFKINEYIKLGLNSAEESSQFYGWGKHISSIENYYGENFENNSIVKQKIFGGEGEGALGYWSRKHRVGVLAHGSLAGFLFRGQNHIYVNYGIHAGYRYLLSNGDRIRFWLGVGYREMPEILTHPFTTNVDVNRVKSFGPEARISYQHEITDKIGISVSGSVFNSMWDKGTPNGQPQLARISHRTSIMGSYLWKDGIKALAGYTYRLDQAAYLSSDTPGAVNNSKIDGHYLTLMLEFALEDPMK